MSSTSSKKILVFGRQRCVHVHRGKECVIISIKEAKALEKKLSKPKKQQQRGGAVDGEAKNVPTIPDVVAAGQRKETTKSRGKLAKRKRMSKKAQQEEEARRTGDVFEF